MEKATDRVVQKIAESFYEDVVCLGLTAAETAETKAILMLSEVRKALNNTDSTPIEKLDEISLLFEKYNINYDIDDEVC